METYEMEPHHAKVLTGACEAWDRAQEAREAISKSGAFYEDRFGSPRAHPALAAERDSKILFSRLLRELRLDIDGPGPRPPDLVGK